jgi:hypothetical protein
MLSDEKQTNGTIRKKKEFCFEAQDWPCLVEWEEQILI